MPPDPTLPPRDAAAHALAGLARDFHARGWCLGTSGNFSVVLTREPLTLLVTQTGRAKQELGADDFVVVDEDARPVPGEAGRPSAETHLHTAIALRAGAGAVLHTHSPASTLLGEHFLGKGGFTLAGYEMLKGLEGIRTHEAAVFVPVLPNDQDVPALRGPALRLFDRQQPLHGFLLAGHGLYTWGDTLEQGRRHVEIFEFLLDVTARRTSFAPFVG